MHIPDTWTERADDLTAPRTLEVAGFSVVIELTSQDLRGVYLPLLAILGEAARGRPGRVLAGLSGIPAGGKSTLAAVLEHVALELLPEAELRVVGMDGWHFPNAVLDDRTTHDENGRPVPLRQRKGGPQSYDIEAMVEALGRLKDRSHDVGLPVYDRRLHEPRPEGLIVAPSTGIVIVEGNYVLGGVEGVPAWDRIASHLTPLLFVDCDETLARRRMIDRHIRGGSSPEEARDKYDRNDRLNAAIISKTRDHADYLIQLNPPQIRPRAV